MKLDIYVYLEKQQDLNFTVVITLKDYSDNSTKTDIIYCFDYINRGILYKSYDKLRLENHRIHA